MDEMDEVNDGWWAGMDDEQRLDHAVLDLGGLRQRVYKYTHIC